MKRGSRNDLYLMALILVIGFSAVFVLSNRIATVKPQLPEQYEDEDLSLEAG